MANKFDQEIMLDGWRNAVVKITGILDSGDANLSPVISLSDFTNNDINTGRLVGFRIDHIWHSIGNGLEIGLFWDATDPQIITAVAGRGKETFGGGLHPRQNNVGYTGNINLITTGFGVQGLPPQNFTVLLEMAKLYSGG